YQWDMLLVEATFLAVLSAPWRWKPELSRWKPPASGVWLTRLLLFRLVFESGCVKLMSGDPSWRSLSALVYHYQTQPLPTWPAWYAHLLPLWAQKLSCALMFAVELGAPWLIWLPRRARLLGGALIAGLMALIAATGNYCFFNALTVLLCLSLVDDQTLGSWASRLIPPPEAEAAPRRWARPLFALLALMALLQVSGFSGALRPPRALEELLSPLAPLRLVNGYGLFAVMTTERLEIEIEGSRDGRRWRPYRFKWKPDDPARRPRFVEPFQPRLDWQMWFAALGSCRENPWFVSLLVRLLQGSPPVLSLLGENPFPKRPPRYVRSTLYRYRFTEPGQSGWWLRRKLGPYCPTLSLSPGAPGFDRMAR
ncbi:MAG: lipase maturation factor family protein, partial [Elusimicrobia bacterium]|nr:lipase maturation factor family protein [Elusimicrobiota bacterium]